VLRPVTEARYWGVIPAAGVGRRMGGAVPKQYLPLRDRPVIDHTVERILLHPLLDGVYVALGSDDAWWPDTEFADHPDLVRVPGGVERCHSVLNALDALAARADADDWVLVHDAARPCVRRADISRLIETLRNDPVGGLLGTPVRDTMKRTDAHDRVSATVERAGLWHAYTPQMFRLGSLRAALSAVLAAGELVTDEAAAMERAGHAPRLVAGHPDNIKITRPEDLELAAYFLAAQERAGD
jgi:2-C-methyl-D-erythritol 4-phosphate cytidylyltransferase